MFPVSIRACYKGPIWISYNDTCSSILNFHWYLLISFLLLVFFSIPLFIWESFLGCWIAINGPTWHCSRYRKQRTVFDNLSYSLHLFRCNLGPTCTPRSAQLVIGPTETLSVSQRALHCWDGGSMPVNTVHRHGHHPGKIFSANQCNLQKPH